MLMLAATVRQPKMKSSSLTATACADHSESLLLTTDTSARAVSFCGAKSWPLPISLLNSIWLDGAHLSESQRDRLQEVCLFVCFCQIQFLLPRYFLSLLCIIIHLFHGHVYYIFIHITVNNVDQDQGQGKSSSPSPPKLQFDH